MAEKAGARDRPVSIGDTLPPLFVPPITRTTLALFAGASGDHNPVHVDIDFAREAGLPDVFAQGMLSTAYLGRLLTQWLPQSRLRSFSVRFVAITHLRNEVRCRGRVVAVEDMNGERCARVSVLTEDQHGELKMLGEAVLAIDAGATS